MVYHPRMLAPFALQLRAGYPALLVTGPRQSGKTTFAQHTFRDLDYVNFEDPVERATFESDPHGFLDRCPRGAVLDEAQLVWDLFSHLQVRIDLENRMGRWVLTGSQQIDMSRMSAQSLAGRVARLELLPFSYAELEDCELRPRTLAEAVLRGGYPPLYDEDRPLEPVPWLQNYLATFVSRDVPDILHVRKRSAFDRFLRLCSGRTGQLLNAAELARDAGVDGKTAADWLSVLEACHVISLLRPHHRNFGKRLIKSPKLYFLDSGLACRLLGISQLDQLVNHPLWGALVETWCYGEVLKTRIHRAKPPDLWFWRSSDGHEVDLLLDLGTRWIPIEVKSATTPRPELGDRIEKLRRISTREPGIELLPGFVVYGGSEERPLGSDRFLPWSSIDQALGGLP